MSGIAKRRQNPIFALGVIGIIVVSVGAWWGFVRSVDREADAIFAKAASLEAELGKGRAFLESRPDDQVTLDAVARTAANLEKRIPAGRHDLQVAQHFEKAAAAAGLLEFSYEVVGGMALTQEGDRPARSPAETLALNPNDLKSVSITLTFRGTYSQMVSLVRAAYESPWHIEINGLEMARDKKTPSLNMQGRLLTRYFYQ